MNVIKRDIGKAMLAAWMAAIGLFGCAAADMVSPVAPSRSAASSAPAPAPPDAAHADKLEAFIASLSLEEKTGQLINIRLDEKNIEIIRKLHLGGVTLFQNNIRTEDQVKKLCADLQAISDIPLLIGIDEEGGQVSRLKDLYGKPYKSAYQIGQTKDPENARSAAFEAGQALKSLGVTIDFAPVADIWSNPKNKVIGDRSYGNTPEAAAPMVAAAVRGFHEAGILSVIKHFPGHGDTAEDSHKTTAIYTHDLERLQSFEQLPFQAGIDAGADGVMIGHIAAPQITGNDLPADFQPFFTEELLRVQMGFTGLIFTDALDMDAITQTYDSDEASVQAFLAGADVLLLPLEPEKAYEALLQACRDQIITEERLNSSVRRILQAKAALGWQIE